MNHIFKSLYNQALGTWVAVPEIAKSHGKTSRIKRAAVALDGKTFTYTAIASALFIASGQAMAVTGAEYQSGTDQICFYDTDSQSVICGDATTSAPNRDNGATPPRLPRSVAIGVGAQITNSFNTGNNPAGNDSVAIGAQSKVTGYESVAIGGQAQANERRAIAVGFGAKADGLYGSAAGYKAEASRMHSTAFGSQAVIKNKAATDTARSDAILASDTANGLLVDSSLPAGTTSASDSIAALAFGRQATAAGYAAMAQGLNANASSAFSTAIGANSIANKMETIAVGSRSEATGHRAIAIGSSFKADVATKASGDNAVAVGAESRAGGAHSVATGYKAQAATENSIAMGNEAKAITNTGTIAIGKSTEATGTSSVAVGTNSKSIAQSTVAIGSSAKAQDKNAVAIGDQAQAAGTGNVAIGQAAGRLQAGSATGNNTVVIGVLAGADSNGNQGQVALGWEAGRNTTGTYNVASGYQAGQYVNGGSNIAIGNKAGQGTAAARLNVQDTIALGSSSVVKGNNAIAIGKGAQATAQDSIAVGTGNVVSGQGSGAFGDPNTVSGAGSYAFGNNNTIKQNNTFVLGNSVATTQANSVVLGNASTDREAKAVNNATVGGITYSGFAGKGDPTKGVVSVGAAGQERQLINVAAGEISAASTDAINGSQLFAVANQVGQLQAGQTHYYSVKSTEQGADSNYDNKGATGTNALAAGVSAKASGASSVAVGHGAQALDGNSVAIGPSAKVDDSSGAGIAIGQNAEVAGGGIALGAAANAKNGGMALGSGADSGTGTPLIPGAPIYLNNNVALGDSAIVKGETNFRVSLGSMSAAGDADLTKEAYKPFKQNVAGVLDPAGTVELGEVSVGGDATQHPGGKHIYRRITNVGAGSDDTDAVNVSQLKALATAVTSGQTHYYSVNSTEQGVDSNYDNKGATGTNALAGGVNTKASGARSMALGENTQALKEGSVAMGAWGNKADARGNRGTVNDSAYAVVIGAAAQTNGFSDSAVVIGNQAQAFGTSVNSTAKDSVAIGFHSTVTAASNIALGSHASADDKSQATAIGYKSHATGYQSIAFGSNAEVLVGGATAIGRNAKINAQGANALALGDGANVGANAGVASGSYATVTAGKGVALGSQSVADRGALKNVSTAVDSKAANNTVFAHGSATADDKTAILNTVKGDAGAVSVGGTYSYKDSNGQTQTGVITRQITNVAAGSNDSDAVNVAQLKAATSGFHILDHAGSTQGTVTASDKVQFVNGAGTTAQVTQETDGTTKITFNVNAQTLAESAQLPVVYTQADGTKVYLVDDPANPGTKVFKLNADGTGATIPAGDVIASMQNPDGTTTNPTTLANVKAGVNGNDAVNVSQLGAAGIYNTNANGDLAYTDANGNTVYRKPDGSYVDAQGNTVTPAPGALTLQNKGLNFAGNTGEGNTLLGETWSIVGGNPGANPSDARTFTAGSFSGGNIKTQVSNGLVEITMADRPKFGDIVINAPADPINNRPAGRITGVTAGVDDDDVVTVRQLNQASAAAKTVVTSNNKTVTVTPTTDTATGATVYDLAVKTGNSLTVDNNTGAINVKTDGTTITTDPTTGAVKANTVALKNGKDGSVTAPSTADAGKLVTAGDIADAINNSGFTLTTSANGGTKDAASTQAEVINPGEVIDIAAGKNLEVKQEANGKVTLSTQDEVEFEQITIPKDPTNTDPNKGNVVINQDGLNNGGNKIINVARGEAGTDAVNKDQLDEVASRPTHITNVDARTYNIINNTTVSAGDNMQVTKQGDNYQVSLAPDITLNSVTTGGVVMNSNGLSVNGNTYVDAAGLNANGQTIRNVAPGRVAADSGDAVNGAQLHQAYQRMGDIDQRARAGIASAMASAGLPQAYRPGANMVAVSAGHYDGQSAVAIGASTISDNGRWILKGTLNVNSKDAGATVGVGYQW